MKIFKLIILDFDGTIADTNRIIVATMQATMRHLGLPVATHEQCSSTIGLPLRQCFTSIITLTDKQADACVECYSNLFRENCARMHVDLFPGVMETLDHWHNAGISLAIASSRSNASLKHFVEDMQLQQHFRAILGGDDVTHAKPHPEPVKNILNRLHIAPEETLVIGDMTYDIEMGRAAGCATAGVTYGNGTAAQLKAAGADYIVDRFDALLHITQ